MSNLSIIYDGAILYVQWLSVAADAHATATVYSQTYCHGHGAGKAVVEVGRGNGVVEDLNCCGYQFVEFLVGTDLRKDQSYQFPMFGCVGENAWAKVCGTEAKTEFVSRFAALGRWLKNDIVQASQDACGTLRTQFDWLGYL